VTFVLFTGVVAGIGHVLLGPDHFAALGPFSVEAHRGAWRVGLRWGLGHSLGILAVALVFVGAADWLDLGLFASAGDHLVGAVLVAVGGWGLWHLRASAELAAHDHAAHTHLHTTAALSIGTLHGLVGTGSTLAVLPAVGMHSWHESGVYLLGFGAGTIASMTAVAWALGALAQRAERELAYRRLFALASLAALGLGLVWLGLALAGVDVHAG
jgi:sulfite exporter TauE/SafE